MPDIETIVVTGDRHWANRGRVRSVLSGLKQGGAERLVHGGCPTGLDAYADQIGYQLGFDVITVFAEWHLHGRAAGPIRNRKMLDDYKPRLVIAFHDNLAGSRGTRDCVAAALERGYPVLLWTSTTVTALDSQLGPVASLDD